MYDYKEDTISYISPLMQLILLITRINVLLIEILLTVSFIIIAYSDDMILPDYLILHTNGMVDSLRYNPNKIQDSKSNWLCFPYRIYPGPEEELRGDPAACYRWQCSSSQALCKAGVHAADWHEAYVTFSLVSWFNCLWIGKC